MCYAVCCVELEVSVLLHVTPCLFVVVYEDVVFVCVEIDIEGCI